MAKPRIEQVERLAYSVDEVAVSTALGRDAIYDAIRSGALVARKCGRRTLILRADLHTYLAGLPDAGREMRS